MLQRVSGATREHQLPEVLPRRRSLAAGLTGGGGVWLYSVARTGDRVDVAKIGGERLEGGSVYGIDVDGAGRIAATSVDGTLRLYDRGLRLIAKRDLSKEDVPLGVRFSPDGVRIAVGYYETARVEIFSAADLKTLETPHVPRTPHRQPRLPSVAWSLDGHYLYAAGHYSQKGRHAIIRWPVENVHNPSFLPIHRTLVRNLLTLQNGGVAYGGVNGDGRVAVVGVSDGTIRWYRMKDGRELAAFYPHADRRRSGPLDAWGYFQRKRGRRRAHRLARQ